MSTGSNSAASPLNNTPDMDHLNELEIMYLVRFIKSESWQWWKTVAGKAAEQMNMRKSQVAQMTCSLAELRLRAVEAETQVHQLRHTIARLQNQLRAATPGGAPTYRHKPPPCIMNATPHHNDDVDTSDDDDSHQD